MERHDATVEKQGACKQHIFHRGGYQITSHFKNFMAVFVKPESLEQPDRTPVDLAVCEQFSLKKLCCSELRIIPARAHEP
ncbi:hypothetical protein C0J52_17618 [Blattella germanica]|nr:hypothetical protein C0J52_17618 [Blattella germanica]